ncbi:hypothetical protein [Xanthomonas cassavae]|uniref:hypothetical protein n=1 Tax=Xanthomonas cassavae TaxID=56450 RepID=UPI000426CE6B|nr:hypothetical protein [Xanthomonas cassavae]
MALEGDAFFDIVWCVTRDDRQRVRCRISLLQVFPVCTRSEVVHGEARYSGVVPRRARGDALARVRCDNP